MKATAHQETNDESAVGNVEEGLGNALIKPILQVPDLDAPLITRGK